ncbi:hypothetical protein AB0C11_32645, partial [Streptomyces sp. NPDC039016]|uniref:hypothetical protein n=1 Tax=Streptomyces sp. NPDC039016 TaxID=3154330 RepID=UPI00340407F6
PVRSGLSAFSRFQPYQIRFRLWPPAGAGSGRFAFAFRPFRLYQIFFPFQTARRLVRIPF